MPYHNYAGPGTNVKMKLDLNVLPTTYLDAAALIHDVEYSYYQDQKVADDNMIDNLSKWSTTVKYLTKAAFFLKDVIGYKVHTEGRTQYLIMRKQARTMLDRTPYKNMRFKDEKP